MGITILLMEMKAVLLYIKQTLKSCQINGDYSRYRDAVWTNIEIMKNKNLLFGCVYRSPNKMIEDNLILIEDMRTINSMKSSMVICSGDFN